MKLPPSGMSREDVMAALRRSMTGDLPWHEGRTFSLIYGAGEEHLELLRDAYSLFMASNGLGAGRMFKSLAALEAEVVGIAAGLLGGPDCPGNVTSGGTESIFMGIRAARQRARAARPEVTAPEMVLPASAHPAFQKAGEVLGITSVRTPLTPGFAADIRAMEAAVNPNTIALVELSHAGWPNGAGTPRGTVQRVLYRVEERKLVREHWNVTDATLATPPVKRELLGGVERIEVRYLDAGRQWDTQWPPLGGTGDRAFRLRPLAVEITLVLEDYGELKRLVEVPG